MHAVEENARAQLRLRATVQHSSSTLQGLTLVPWTPCGHWTTRPTPQLLRTRGSGLVMAPPIPPQAPPLGQSSQLLQLPRALPPPNGCLDFKPKPRNTGCCGRFFFSSFAFFWREAILEFKFSIPFGLHNYSFTDPAKAVVLHRDDFAPKRHVATSRGICVVTAGGAGEASGMQRAEARDAPHSPAPQQKIVRLRCPQGQGGTPGHGVSGQVL